MLSQLDHFKNFRQTIYLLFNKRKDAIMNLLDAISSFGHRSRSVVQLSEAHCFKRKYSSITDAVSDGLPDTDWTSITKHIFKTMFDRKAGKPPCFVVDCTPNPRPFSKKVADRTVTHFPNPAPGNKPICVGHQYSCVALLPTDALAQDKKWIVPLSMSRVGSEQKGNEVGMQQIIDHTMQFGLKHELVVSVGDSLYGTEKCRIIAESNDDLVHIFRVNMKRNLFCTPAVDSSKIPGRGRKKEYGAKMSLHNSDTHPEPDKKSETAWQTRAGKIYRVIIDSWENMLMRGSKNYRSAQHPMTLIRIRVLNDKEELAFKRPLWLALFGKRRDEISLISAYQYYSSRYDMEHFFRFGKNKLLLSDYQTADVAHEENWWNLCALAYNQLYLAKSLVSQLPKPWEKYLPEYTNTTNKPNKITTPSQTQRGFETLLETVGSPAAPCVPRGKSPGRAKGETGPRREDQDIIFKTKKSPGTGETINISGCDIYDDSSNPKEINALIQHVHSTLGKFSFPTTQFTQILFNTS